MFQPDFAGNWQAPSYEYPKAQAADNGLFGVGAYVDVRFSRWVQIEAEGRWQRFNQYANIHEDNYLVGPRVPIRRFWKANVYGKALVGFSNMNFDTLNDHGRFTTLAFGGGADIRITRKLSFRAVDVEYQYWPEWGNTSLSPYGVSMGVGYKVF